MKNLIKTLLVAVMLTVAGSAASAQQQSTQPGTQRITQQQRMSREQLADVQARRIAQSLAFSDDVTEKFVKTYTNCQKEVWALRPKQQRPENGKKATRTEKENEERIKQRFEISEKMLDIRKKYYKEYSKFLTQTQIERVYKQERSMMNRMAKRTQMKRNGQRPPMKPNGQRPSKPNKLQKQAE